MEQRYSTLSLFPDDREVPAEAIDSIQVKLSEMELRCPRAFGLARVLPVAAVGITQHLSLHHQATIHSPVLDYTEIAV